jgi:hypothetical protein
MVTKRKVELKFHVIHKDYFGTLANILNLLRQGVAGLDTKRKQRTLLKDIIEDLLYFQSSYEIKLKKSLNKNSPKNSSRSRGTLCR